jgi:hypothetical protein
MREPSGEDRDLPIAHIECLFVSRGLCRLVVDPRFPLEVPLSPQPYRGRRSPLVKVVRPRFAPGAPP